MRKKTIFVILISALLLWIMGCTVDNDGNNSDKYLKFYGTLTPITVTEAMIDEILDSFNDPEIKDSALQKLTVFPVRMYKISYRTYYKGNKIIASGAVTIPQAEGVFPVIIYNHGTIFKDSFAPSRYNGNGDRESETTMNLIFSSTGFISVSPDYIGYGESSDLLHPYHIEAPSASNTLDMLRAVKEFLTKTDVSWKDEYFIAGYSEGGYAGLSVQKVIEKEYSSEFPVKASSLGAGAYYLSETIKTILGKKYLISPAYIAFILSGYNNYYDMGRDPSEFFRSPYDDDIRNGILNGSLSQDEINSMLPFKTTLLFKDNFLSLFRGNGESQLKSAFIENDLINGWFPTVPTRFYHGTSDETVPPFNSQTARNLFHSSGSNAVYYIPLKNRDHSTAILPWIKDTIIWFNSLK